MTETHSLDPFNVCISGGNARGSSEACPESRINIEGQPFQKNNITQYYFIVSVIVQPESGFFRDIEGKKPLHSGPVTP
jgi:hypothetical protein